MIESKDYKNVEESSYEEQVLERLDVIIQMLDYYISKFEEQPADNTAPIGRGTAKRINSDRN